MYDISKIGDRCLQALNFRTVLYIFSMRMSVSHGMIAGILKSPGWYPQLTDKAISNLPQNTLPVWQLIAAGERTLGVTGTVDSPPHTE